LARQITPATTEVADTLLVDSSERPARCRERSEIEIYPVFGDFVSAKTYFLPYRSSVAFKKAVK
jgi:hypothetical protein